MQLAPDRVVARELLGIVEEGEAELLGHLGEGQRTGGGLVAPGPDEGRPVLHAVVGEEAAVPHHDQIEVGVVVEVGRDDPVDVALVFPAGTVVSAPDLAQTSAKEPVARSTLPSPSKSRATAPLKFCRARPLSS